MSESVSVPAELIEALAAVVEDWQYPLAVWDGEAKAIFRAARALVDAVERPSEDEPKVHAWEEGETGYECVDCGRVEKVPVNHDCALTAASVSDEAEAEKVAIGAWMEWVHDKAIDQGDGPVRHVFVSGWLAGFRAGRGEEA